MKNKSGIALFALSLATAAFADGPGSRIRAGDTPQLPRAVEKDAKRCEALRDEEKERCLKKLRAAAAANEKRRGPEATGAGSFGASAPR